MNSSVYICPMASARKALRSCISMVVLKRDSISSFLYPFLYSLSQRKISSISSGDKETGRSVPERPVSCISSSAGNRLSCRRSAPSPFPPPAGAGCSSSRPSQAGPSVCPAASCAVPDAPSSAPPVRAPDGRSVPDGCSARPPAAGCSADRGSLFSRYLRRSRPYLPGAVSGSSSIRSG